MQPKKKQKINKPEQFELFAEEVMDGDNRSICGCFDRNEFDEAETE